MNESSNNLRQLNGGQNVIPAGADQASRELAEARNARQSRWGSMGTSPPDKRPPDQLTWYGGRKYSPAARRHNDRVDEIGYAKEEAEYAMRLGFELDYLSLRESASTVLAEVEIYRSLPTGSLEAEITRELLLDSADRIQRLVTKATENFVRRALG